MALCLDKVDSLLPRPGARTSRYSIGMRSEQNEQFKILNLTAHLRLSASVLERDIWLDVRLWRLAAILLPSMSAFGGKADIRKA